MSNFEVKLSYGHYGEYIVGDWLRSNNYIVTHTVGRCIWDLEYTKQDTDKIIKADVKCKRSMDVYRNLTGMDYNDWCKYLQYDNFFIFFVDWREGCCYGDTVRNMKNYVMELFLDSTKYTNFKLATFEINKMKKLFTLTKIQIQKLKELEQNKKTNKDYSLMADLL